MSTRKTGLFAALAAVLVVAVAGYWGYRAHEKKQQERAIVAALADTTVQLRQALAGSPSGEAFSKIDAYLGAVQGAHRQPVLADAAEHYILGAREVVRRRIEAARLERRAALNRQALSTHMARAGSRNSSWIHDATELKKRVERDHFDLNLTLRAMDELLGGLPDAYKVLAAQVDPALLLEESLLQTARRQAQDEAKRAAAELERLRGLSGR